MDGPDVLVRGDWLLKVSALLRAWKVLIDAVGSSLTCENVKVRGGSAGDLSARSRFVFATPGPWTCTSPAPPPHRGRHVTAKVFM